MVSFCPARALMMSRPAVSMSSRVWWERCSDLPSRYSCSMLLEGPPPWSSGEHCERNRGRTERERGGRKGGRRKGERIIISLSLG